MGYTACPVTYAKSVVVGGDSCTNGDYPELRKQRHSRKGGLRGRQAVTASEKTSPIRSSSGAEKHCTPKLTTTECGRGRTACESACVSADSVLGDARLKLDDCCCSDRYSNIMGLIWQKIGEARALRQHNFIKEARLKLHHARGLLKSISISGAGCCVVRQQRSLEDLRRKIDALADGLSSPRFRNSLRAEVSRLASRSPAHRGRCASESSTSTTTSNERVRGDGPREHTIKGLNCGCKMPTQPTRSSSPIEQRCSRRVQKFKKCAYEADHLKAHSNVNHFNGSVNLESYHNEIFREWDLTTGVTQRAMSDLYETGPKSSRRHLKVDDGSSGRHNVCCACLHPASAADGSLSRSSKCFAPPCCTPMATGRKNVREAAEGGEYSCKNNGDDSLLAARCHTQVYTPTPSAPITASSPQLLSSHDSLPEHSVRAASHLFHSKAPGAAGGDPCFKQNALLRTFRIPARNSLGRKGMEKAIQPTALPHTPPARSRLNGYTYSSNLQTPFPPAMGNERQEPCHLLVTAPCFS
ncbi:hypothetical protein ERJ75_000875600 [Trypanosoma vivax]|nr:hypothetical protein ERJ75_000875600 [Trypanosoma vivax]